MSLFWVIFSYLLGSIPFGYLISRLSGKNILEVGWRKTSGSNVFKNVGKWQGVLTGILDVSKGYLAVYGAQRLGFSLEIQIFSGVVAVAGHNWSIFLKFAGGRGIGTFIGAFFALSPQILLFGALTFLFLAIIFDSAIATLLFLIATIFLSIYLNKFETEGVFVLLSLIPILIKRLSPINEIRKSLNKSALFWSRILFDNDEVVSGTIIATIFKKKSPRKILKPLTDPLLVAPKVGWKAAKYGAKLAKEKLPFLNGEKVVVELGPKDLKKMMLAAGKKIVFYQDEINKINVFPVADKDTGYNLAATLLGIEGVISQKKYSTLRELSKDIREAAIVNARGNAGMIYTGYLSEVLDRIKHLETIDAFHLALAMQKGIKAARLTIAEPVEGTILDVIEASGEQAFEMASIKKEKNIIKVLEEAKKVSEIALAKTKEKLEVLRQNDVVDAGALGFVKILEAWLECLKGNNTGATRVILSEEKVEQVIFEPQVEGKLKYQYDLVFCLKVKEDSFFSTSAKASVKDEQCNFEELLQELSLLGDSIDVLESEDKVKIHIHTNSPEEVKERIKGFDVLEWQVEDMARQVKKSVERKPLGLIVGETADLPREFLEKNQIEMVPFRVNFSKADPTWKSLISNGARTIPDQSFYEKMKKAKKLPTTAAPPFGEYLTHYKRALGKFEKILVITLPSRLSGAYSQARIARSIFKKPEKLNIFVFDCFLASGGEGLVVIKAQELIEKGKNLEEVVAELKEFCPKVKLLGIIDDLKYGVAGGRFPYYLPKFLVKTFSLLKTVKIHPLIELKDGKIRFLGIKLTKAKDRILAKEVEKQRKGKEIRAVIGHADNLKEAILLKEELEKNPKIKVLYIFQVSPVIGIHAGPGTLLVAFHPVDLVRNF